MSAPPGEEPKRYTAAREIVATMWDGARTIRRIGLTQAEQEASCASLTDAEITKSLQGLNVSPIPPTPEERQARLASWPSPADLDAVAVGLIPENYGVRPTVRVISTTFRWTGLPT